MFFLIKSAECFGNLNEVASLQSQVKGLRLQDKLGEQNYQDDMKTFQEPLFVTFKNTSESVT